MPQDKEVDWSPKAPLLHRFRVGLAEHDEVSLEVTTYAAYEKAIRARINAYFDRYYPKLLLQEVTPRHIQAFCSYEIEELGIKPSTVLHHHANIRKALQYAYKTDLIPSNPADKVQRPKKNACETNPYNSEELEKLFELVKGTQLELGVLFAAFYGLRRGEIVGLKFRFQKPRKNQGFSAVRRQLAHRILSVCFALFFNSLIFFKVITNAAEMQFDSI